MKQSVDKPKVPQPKLFAMRIGAIILASAGVGFLLTATVHLVLLGCPMSIIKPLSWGGLGLIALFLDTVLLVAMGLKTHRWKGVFTALGFIAGGLAFLYFAVVPWAAEQRIARHQRQMTDVGVPALNAVVASVEAMREKTGEIPADENEFFTLISERDLRTLDELRCCWGIDYRKVDSRHYELRYWAMDVEYVYESQEAGRGWYPVQPDE